MAFKKVTTNKKIPKKSYMELINIVLLILFLVGSILLMVYLFPAAVESFKSCVSIFADPSVISLQPRMLDPHNKMHVEDPFTREDFVENKEDANVLQDDLEKELEVPDQSSTDYTNLLIDFEGTQRLNTHVPSYFTTKTCNKQQW